MKNFYHIKFSSLAYYRSTSLGRLPKSLTFFMLLIWSSLAMAQDIEQDKTNLNLAAYAGANSTSIRLLRIGGQTHSSSGEYEIGFGYSFGVGGELVMPNGFYLFSGISFHQNNYRLKPFEHQITQIRSVSEKIRKITAPFVIVGYKFQLARNELSIGAGLDWARIVSSTGAIQLDQQPVAEYDLTNQRIGNVFSTLLEVGIRRNLGNLQAGITMSQSFGWHEINITQNRFDGDAFWETGYIADSFKMNNFIFRADIILPLARF